MLSDIEEQMAGRGAGDGLAQYAGGKLRSRLCESLRERICLEETVSCTVSTVVRMCPSVTDIQRRHL